MIKLVMYSRGGIFTDKSILTNLQQEWNYERNTGYEFDDFQPGSDEKVWWRCSKGHEWEAMIRARVYNKTGCPYCSGLLVIKGENDLLTTNPDIIGEWDYEKNEIKPDEIKAGTSKKVYWKCEKGHRWQATIASRTKLHTQCPYCIGKLAIIGQNDLKTTYPELAKEWDYDKNTVSINEVMGGSAKKVWWKCKFNHSYEAAINSRTKMKSGCPYCSGNKPISGVNDLETQYPDIAKEWDYLKNSIQPSSVSSRSSYKAWWLCQNGHSYYAIIAGRTGPNRLGCPYCSGQKVLKGFNDLESLYPELAKEWDYAKNDSLMPSDITSRNPRVIWWVCPKKHEYKASVYNRVTGDNCPICSNHQCLSGYNDLVTQKPELAKEWNYNRNGNLRPNQVVYGSNEKVWWQCEWCGYEWHASICSRGNGSGCPKCNRKSRTSFPEQTIYYYIKQRYSDAQNGYNSIFDKKQMELDIYIPSLRLGIEYDGKAWHSGDKNKEKELKKYEICKIHNITLIRIKENNADNSKDTSDYLIHTGNDYNTSFFVDIFEKLYIYTNYLPDIDIERDTNFIKEQYYSALKNNSIGVLYESLKDEWHPTLNGNLTPFMFLRGSTEKVWWLCRQCGYEWKAVIQSRTNGCGCPQCGRTVLGKKIVANRLSKKVTQGNKVIQIDNTISNVAPWLADEWNYEKNCLSPEELSPQSGKKVWWKCKNNHEWEEGIQYRFVNKLVCPYCSGRWVTPGINDLATLYPYIAEEWDYDKNKDCDINKIKIGSIKEVWWKCKNCGDNWKTKVVYRTKMNKSCPKCKKI